MTNRDVILELCREKGISVRRLETDCGFSNGYIKGIKNGMLPADRLYQLSKYFSVSMEYLMTGEEIPSLSDPDEIPSDYIHIKDISENETLREIIELSGKVSNDDLKIALDMLRRCSAYREAIKTMR